MKTYTIIIIKTVTVSILAKLDSILTTVQAQLLLVVVMVMEQDAVCMNIYGDQQEPQAYNGSTTMHTSCFRARKRR